MSIRTMTAIATGLFILCSSALAQSVSYIGPLQPVVEPPKDYVSLEPQQDILAEAAALYATYQNDVTQVKEQNFRSALDIDTSLMRLGGHNPNQLTQGWMAYSALIAAQNPEFRAAIRDIEGYYGRERLIQGLEYDRRYARSLGGGTSAIGQALTAVKADSQRLIDTAELVKQQAYSLQGAGWAKSRIRNSGATADQLLQSTSLGLPANYDLYVALQSPDMPYRLSQAGRRGAPSLWEPINQAARAIRLPNALTDFGQRQSIAVGKEAVADRIMTLAAYRILEADPIADRPMRLTMRENDMTSCLNMANLNLQQCVAATHRQYEVPFCIGEHALSDIGKCMGRISR